MESGRYRKTTSRQTIKENGLVFYHALTIHKIGRGCRINPTPDRKY